jgi:putative endonuclease
VSVPASTVPRMGGPVVDERSERGRAGEDAAQRVYERRGYVVVARNWRCPIGELDLVLLRRGLLVFCEVKTRSGPAFGGGYEAVSWSKRKKIRSLAEVFVQQNGFAHVDVRFDVASVWLNRGGHDVEVFEDAF